MDRATNKSQAHDNGGIQAGKQTHTNNQQTRASKRAFEHMEGVQTKVSARAHKACMANTPSQATQVKAAQVCTRQIRPQSWLEVRNRGRHTAHLRTRHIIICVQSWQIHSTHPHEANMPAVMTN
eukprot:600137-Pelagomonas_calceolata.AAC.2